MAHTTPLPKKDVFADQPITTPSIAVNLEITLLMAVVLLAQVVPTVAEDHRTFEYQRRTIVLKGVGGKGGTLGVVDGDVRWIDAISIDALTEWTLRETEKGWTIQVPATKEKPDRYLSVDARGKISLVSEPSDGAYWKLTPKHLAIEESDATLRVSGGKFDGQYLGVSEDALQSEEGNGKRKLYPVTLSEKSGPGTQLRMYLDGP